MWPKEMQPSVRFAVLGILPVVAVHLSFVPFWIAKTYTAPGALWLPGLSIDITALYIPVYLAILGCLLVLGFVAARLAVGSITLLAAFALDIILPYAAWGICSVRFWTPDEETLMIFRAEAKLGLAIVFVPALLALVVRYVVHSVTRSA